MKIKKYFIFTGIDGVLMYCSLYSALSIRFGSFPNFQDEAVSALFVHFSLLHALYLILLYACELYTHFNEGRKRQLSKIAMFFFFAISMSALYFYFQPQLLIAPKTILLIHLLIFSIFLIVTRSIYGFLHKGLKETIALILPDVGRMPNFEKELALQQLELLVFIPQSRQPIDNHFFTDEQCFISALKEKNVQKVIFFPSNEVSQVLQSLYGSVPTLSFQNLISFYEKYTSKIPFEYLNNGWVFENLTTKRSLASQTLKRLLDIAFSFFSIVLTFWLFLIAALFIKITSPGPILYAQIRVGKNGKPFRLYKFRTMVVDAEKNGPQWAQKNDTRITPIGKVLRRLYIDELPQFINILRGDISIVGPRPERPEFVNSLKVTIPFYEARLFAKPGLTGWAQIQMDAPVDIEETREKLRYDIFYIKNQSLLFDLAILLRTLRRIFLH